MLRFLLYKRSEISEIPGIVHITNIKTRLDFTFFNIRFLFSFDHIHFPCKIKKGHTNTKIYQVSAHRLRECVPYVSIYRGYNSLRISALSTWFIGSIILASPGKHRLRECVPYVSVYRGYNSLRLSTLST